MLQHHGVRPGGTTPNRDVSSHSPHDDRRRPAGLTEIQPSTPVAVGGAPTGLDSGEPPCLRAVIAAVALPVSQGVAHSETARRRAISRAAKEVSGSLGNAPAVCRASYINPGVIQLYEAGVTIASQRRPPPGRRDSGLPATHGPTEQAVLHMLRTGRPHRS